MAWDELYNNSWDEGYNEYPPSGHLSPYEQFRANGGDEKTWSEQYDYVYKNPETGQYDNGYINPDLSGNFNWYTWATANSTPPPPTGGSGSGSGSGSGGNWPGTEDDGGGSGSGGSGGSGGGGGYGGRTEFDDPLTQQYERMLQTQLDLYGRQQQDMTGAVEQARAARAATAAAVQRLSAFLNQRVGTLQGPAYTGAESEVLRTQLLDPMERDREAARQRALQQISSRGFDPSSGVAQDLLRQVDQAFDSYRISAQGGLAKAQIQEQRSREQEAQALLQYLAMLPDAVARGDLDFVAYVQQLVAHPGEQGLAIGQMLADLPTKRLNDALATMGIAPSLSGASSAALQALQQQSLLRQLQSQNMSSVWGNIGRSIF